MGDTLTVGRGLRISFLGQPRFCHDGKPFAFHGRPRVLALLAFLLLHRGAHLTRDLVAFTLWPDDGEDEARGKLRRHLYHLNGALPPGDVPYVISEEDTLRWNDDAGVRLDIDDFARDLGDEGRWAEAVELYQGDLVPTVYDDWIFPIRDRYRREYLATLERLLGRARSRRDFSPAATYAERILAHDPWREDVLRTLASIRYESGDRAGALREIDAFAQRLKDEMGVELMPETLVLRALLLRGGALPGAAEPPSSQGRPQANPLPFVGREVEYEQLLGGWRRAARNRGEFVLLGGEAGIGKTRLASELALLVNAQGGRVLRGTTSSPEQMPYQPIIEALRDALPLLAAIEIRPIWLAALAVLVPDLALRRADLPALSALDAKRERSRLMEALAATFHALTQQRPLLLIFEDIQWAGGATLDTLEYLARRVAAMPALVVATYRNEVRDEARVVQPLRRKLQLENVIGHVSLGGLSRDAVCELARNIPELRDDAEAAGAHAHAVSSGNPLFAVELLRERAESGASEAPSLGLRAMIEVRTSRISANARTIADVASVAGPTFDTDLLREVSGLPEDAVLDGINELLGRNVVRDVGRVGFAFAFSHAMIARTVYENVPPQRRAQWHRRVAAAIERGTSGRDEAASILALHYEKAGDSEMAAPYHLVAALRAFAVFANQEALAGATRGLELANDPRRQSELLGLRERILGRLGEREAQRADIDALGRLASDETERADVLWRRAQLARALGELADEAHYLEEFAGRVSATDDLGRQAAGRRSAARNLMSRGRYEEADAAAESALGIYRTLGDAGGEVEALCLIAEIAVNHGTPARVDGALEDARARAESGDDQLLAARVAMASAAVAINRRDFPRALGYAQEAQRRYREIGDREGEAEAGTRVATALSFHMRFEEASSEFAAAARIYRALGNRLQFAYLLFNQTGAHLQLGLLDDARSSLTSALEIFEAIDDTRGRAACLTNLSMVRLLQQAPAEAKEIGARALVAAAEIGNHAIEAGALANLGNAERELGELDAALAHMKEAIAIRGRLGRSATFEELGDLALAQLQAGDVAALETANDILQHADESGENVVLPYYCFWAAARVYHAHRDPAAATALKRAAALVSRQLQAMADERSREAFARLPAVRAIAAAERGDWP